jgi:hypothetical protein
VEYIKKTNISMLLLVLVSARMLFPDASVALSIFGLGLSGLFAYGQYLKSKQVPDINEEIKKELSSMKSSISGLSVRSGFKSPPPEGQKYF